MTERIVYPSQAIVSLLILGLALLLSTGVAGAESEKEHVPAMLSPPSQGDQSLLKRRLRIARRDIEAYRIFAENFRNNGDMKTLAQLQDPVDKFMRNHVDNLLAQSDRHATLETARLTAEIMFIKARLLMVLNRRDSARETVAEMKRRFGSYQKISVELPGKTTTLDDGIKLLDEELTKTAASLD